mmetsp:Transcript_117102/g.331425  ORF Transcript_117102/g.331425 Transcript_117102/m.331425 type:complete len:337 (+) Transcript_117102:492-1502(+)
MIANEAARGERDAQRSCERLRVRMRGLCVRHRVPQHQVIGEESQRQCSHWRSVSRVCHPSDMFALRLQQLWPALRRRVVNLCNAAVAVAANADERPDPCEQVVPPRLVVLCLPPMDHVIFAELSSSIVVHERVHEANRHLTIVGVHAWLIVMTHPTMLLLQGAIVGPVQNWVSSLAHPFRPIDVLLDVGTVIELQARTERIADRAPDQHLSPSHATGAAVRPELLRQLPACGVLPHEVDRILRNQVARVLDELDLSGDACHDPQVRIVYAHAFLHLRGVLDRSGGEQCGGGRLGATRRHTAWRGVDEQLHQRIRIATVCGILVHDAIPRVGTGCEA